MKRLYIILICALGIALATPQVVASQSHDHNKEMTSVSVAPTMKILSTGVELSSYDGAAHRFNIYSITGQMIKSIEVLDNTVTIDLPKGFYIVKCDSWSKQLVIR